MRRAIASAGTFRLQMGETKKLLSPGQIFDPLVYGQACNAQAILTGCVRQSGDRVRLITRMVRCDTGDVIWRRVESVSADRVATDLPTAARAIIEELDSKWHADPRAFAKATSYSPLAEAKTFYSRAIELAARTKQSDLEAAVSSLRHASDVDPQFAAARAMLAFALWVQADTYGELHKLPLAISAAREAIAVDPDSAQAHRVIASCLFKGARYSEALKEFWIALEENPQSAGCCQSLGICLREMGHPLEAIPWLSRAARLDPAHGTTSATLGESFALCGYDQQAEAALTRAIELEDDRPDFQIGMSALRTWQKQFGEARRLCSQTCRRYPDTRFGLSLAAWIELCDGNRSKAEVLFEKLRTENSYQQNWEFYGAINPSSALAYLAKETGSNERLHLFAEEALKTDRELLDKYPNNSRILHDLAATFAVSGDPELALQYLEKSLLAGWAEDRSTEIDPRFSSLANLARFRKILHDTTAPPL